MQESELSQVHRLQRRKWYRRPASRRSCRCEYHHLVFTIPSQLADLAEYNDVLIYDILFQSAAEALLYVGEHWSWLLARLGFNAILHSWGSSFMQLHPHLHILASGGRSVLGWHALGVACQPGPSSPRRCCARSFASGF